MHKICDKLKNNKYSIISFVASSLCMYMILAYAGVMNGGANTLLNGDLLSIYIPAIRNLCRDIVNGSSLTCIGDRSAEVDYLVVLN